MLTAPTVGTEAAILCCWSVEVKEDNIKQSVFGLNNWGKEGGERALYSVMSVAKVTQENLWIGLRIYQQPHEWGWFGCVVVLLSIRGVWWHGRWFWNVVFECSGLCLRTKWRLLGTEVVWGLSCTFTLHHSYMAFLLLQNFEEIRKANINTIPPGEN